MNTQPTSKDGTAGQNSDTQNSEFGDVIALSRTAQQEYRTELYRRSHECKDRFPARYTEGSIPLPFAVGNGRLGQSLFSVSAGDWFAANGIAFKVGQPSQFCTSYVLNRH